MNIISRPYSPYVSALAAQRATQKSQFGMALPEHLQKRTDYVTSSAFREMVEFLDERKRILIWDLGDTAFGCNVEVRQDAEKRQANADLIVKCIVDISRKFSETQCMRVSFKSQLSSLAHIFVQVSQTTLSPGVSLEEQLREQHSFLKRIIEQAAKQTGEDVIIPADLITPLVELYESSSAHLLAREVWEIKSGIKRPQV